MAPSTTITTILGKTALFGALPHADRQAIVAEMRRATFKSGQTIFARGDPSRDVYLVVDGSVRLSVFSTDGRTLSFKHASPGDTFGEIACLDGGVRSADATAITRVETMILPQARFDTLMETNPRVARAAVAFLCQRLRETSEQSEAIALHPIETRLARFFLSKCKGRDHGGKHSFDLGMSQSELALLVGASRQKVNAALALLESAGAVKRSRSHIICNIGKLQRVAASAP